MMNGELQTIKNYKSNPKIFVINNNMYGLLEGLQIYLEPTIGTDTTNGVIGTNIKRY